MPPQTVSPDPAAGPHPEPRAWETFAHGADVGVRGYGASLAEAFANTALALTSVVTDPNLIHSRERVAIACQAPDPEVLLLDWLNQLIFRMSAEGLLFGRFEVEIGREGLKAVAFGEPLDPLRHAPAVEVKGATFTELEVEREPNGRWRAQCVVDV